MGSPGNKNKDKLDVAYMANLSRLELTDEEQKYLGRQLNDILDYISKLNEVDTNGVEPTSHVIALENVGREDKETASLPIDEVLKNAPSKEGKFFRVPKIIE